MEPAVFDFDRLEAALQTEGPIAAIDELCAQVERTEDYPALFYALAMKKRHELGVLPVPTAPSQDLPAEVLPAYEKGLADAARRVGSLALQRGHIPQAWMFFRMLDESEPVRAAIETYQPDREADIQPVIQVAFAERVHPRKGFDWILERYGICSAITTLGGGEIPLEDEIKRYCIQALVRALHRELRERVMAEITEREGKAPEVASEPHDTPGILPRLLAMRDYLFADEAYHIDQSHLSSVVQMSVHLEPGLELTLARELCGYGQRLSGRFLPPGDAPFEDLYKGYGHFLAALDGDEVEENVGYFREQAETADPNVTGTYPAEVLVNLLVRLKKYPEALAVARKYLSQTGGQRLTCPGIPELCQKAGDFSTLAAFAREQGDVVHFLAGKIAAAEPRTQRSGVSGP
jgi:hypothetical protein